MPLDDEQLDELLRDVSVPRDLKAKLLEIPNHESEATSFPPRSIAGPLRSKSYTAMLGTIAAIAATVLVVLYIAPSQVAEIESNVDESETVEMLLAELEQNQKSMNELLRFQEMANEQTHSLSIEPIYDPDETVALALSMSWQSSLDQGASLESVEEELEYVVATYPNTQGAMQARQILQIN